MNIREYHAHPALSRSQISDFLRSPLFFYKKHVEKSIIEPPRTEFAFGNLVHTLLLEPHKLDAEFLIADCKTRHATNVYTEAVAQADKENKILVLSKEVEDAKLMLNNIKLDLSKATVEMSYFFQQSDIAFKCRPDIIMNDGQIIDLKTTSSAKFDDFTYSVSKYDYDLQAYMMHLGTGLIPDPSKFSWLIVEKAEPFLTATYRASGSVFELGARKFKKFIKYYKACIETNNWPQFLEDGDQIEIPHYILNKW
jgi:hypothetical protein